MRFWPSALCLLAIATAVCAQTGTNPAMGAPRAEAGPQTVIIPIKGDIDGALTFVVRRGVKIALDRGAQHLVLHMDTDGGPVTDTTEIMAIIQRFKPEANTYTLVDKKAYSAGSFIAASTRHIYMVPGSVIGAATPILITGQELGEAVQAKMNSALRAMVRAAAERHGHRAEVFEAMIEKDRGLKIGDKVIVPEGEILTLTAEEAAKTYGDPPQPLLSSGTVNSMDEMLAKAGLSGAEIIQVEQTGFETAARWIVSIAPILLLAGIVGIYVEFKVPGFGLPGIAGATCLLLFFFGHQIAGLSGHEALVLFGIGIILVALEIFVFPGTLLPGAIGAALIVTSLLMAMVDYYPRDPVIPEMSQLQRPLLNLTISLVGAGIVIAFLAMTLPSTSLFATLTVKSTSGRAVELPAQVGDAGVAASDLRPAGKATFGDRLEDVVTEGDFIARGDAVRVVAVEGLRIVVVRA
ncbi:MAG TPA: NfeD family protein [Verrucomicrobiae bacterium]|nr:NfeD family protein [Verrucomicrobiae bacterium]